MIGTFSVIRYKMPLFESLTNITPASNVVAKKETTRHGSPLPLNEDTQRQKFSRPGNSSRN